MKWYTIEVIYDGENQGTTDLKVFKNLEGKDLMKIRETMFTAGLYVDNPEHPGTEGEIIVPWRIRKVLVWMQKEKFK